MGLTVEHLTGGYGHIPVLHDLSFHVESGELVGLIGLNGAGKSTTIKHITGLLPKQKGTIKIDDQSIDGDLTTYRQKMGFIPESPSLYEELTLKEHIDVTIMAYNLNKDAAWDRAQALLKTFRLDQKLDWFPTNFSKGMKQKVMILCAFLIQPSLYIIDEPFLGLDPLAIDALLQLMTEMKQNGAAILMSTHVLATAERFCDRFIILHEGKVLAEGTLSELQETFDMPDATLDDLYLRLTKDGEAS